MSPASSLPAAAVATALVVCDDCDAVHARRLLLPGTVARCARCGALLGRGRRLGVQGRLALAVAALVALAVGNAFDIATLDLRGVHVDVTLHEAIAHTWRHGERLAALLAGATALAFPLLLIALDLWLLAQIAAGRRPAGFVAAMRALRWATRWSMVEVFLLGIVIATVRSAGIASLVVGPGLFAYAALTVLLAVEQAAGLRSLWRLGAGLAR